MRLAIWHPTVGNDHSSRGHVDWQACQQHSVKPQPIADLQPCREHPHRVTLPSPRLNHMKADVTAGLAQLRGQAMTNHQGSDVVLAPHEPDLIGLWA